MTDQTAVAEVLERAADLLWLRGRTIGRMQRDERVCLAKAVYEAGGIVDPWCFGFYDQEHLEPAASAGLAFERYLAEHAELLTDDERRWVEEDGSVPAWVWNDHRKPTPENDAHVIDTLRRCAKDLRNGETV